ncbi:MAG: c-type cytochrome [Pseudomonadota bacterium]
MINRMLFRLMGASLLAGGMLISAAYAADTGQSLFTERCGMCHQTNGMGVGILSRRAGDTSKGLLEQRTDLSAAVVRVVVRNGIGNMPRISRAEASDPQLALIADYLSRGKP